MLNTTRRRRRHRRHQKEATTTTSATGNRIDPTVAIERTSNSTLPIMIEQHQPPASWVVANAVLYVLSGVTQPILMAYAQHAGLANPRCQLYMLFYYIGPASVALSLRCSRPHHHHRRSASRKSEEQFNGSTNKMSSMQQHAACSNNCDDDMQRLLSNGEDDLNSNDAIPSCSNGSNGESSYSSTSESVTPHSSSHNGGNISGNSNVDIGHEYEKEDNEGLWPSRSLGTKASIIALFDICAQSMVYTGNNLAGPTIFSIIYSSVTIWAALYSKIFLSRSLSKPQWMGVCLVVLGLSLTATDSLAVGKQIFLGACLILVGSSFHGLTYVLSERIMTAPSPKITGFIGPEDAPTTTMMPANNNNYHSQQEEKQQQHISVRGNCAIQGIVATLALLLWQLVYTLPRRQLLILDPMADAGTTPLQALAILGAISFSNLLHSVTFFATLKYFPGGATSAGALKGLQAVMVFATSALLLCGRWGGIEMCWSRSKGLSLIVVVCGILLYGTFTEKGRRAKGYSRGLSMRQNGEYKSVEDEQRVMCV